MMKPHKSVMVPMLYLLSEKISNHYFECFNEKLKYRLFFDNYAIVLYTDYSSTE